VIKNEEQKTSWESTSENDAHLSAEEMQKRNADRMSRISELSKKLKSSNGLNDLENEPAYKRRNISLKDGPHSSESTVSKFTISEGEDGNNELRSNNSFLHDNVD
jgi:cell division protein FtsZ